MQQSITQRLTKKKEGQYWYISVQNQRGHCISLLHTRYRYLLCLVCTSQQQHCDQNKVDGSDLMCTLDAHDIYNKRWKVASATCKKAARYKQKRSGILRFQIHSHIIYTIAVRKVNKEYTKQNIGLLVFDKYISSVNIDTILRIMLVSIEDNLIQFYVLITLF